MDTGHKVILKSWILMYWLQTLAKQFSTKVLKFGTLFLFQSLVRQIFLALQWNCKSFYRTFAALIPFLTIVL